ncbi:MAG: hypothetical protein FWB74_10495 [Defluviitaleaceae bacterium]|nr:hypothetical protein [Defluviitaleaceae bacterium]
MRIKMPGTMFLLIGGGMYLLFGGILIFSWLPALFEYPRTDNGWATFHIVIGASMLPFGILGIVRSHAYTGMRAMLYAAIFHTAALGIMFVVFRSLLAFALFIAPPAIVFSIGAHRNL